MAQTPKTQPGYLFPILKPNTVLQSANELLGLELTSKELSEPHRHKESLRLIFTKCIEIFLGIPEAELYTIPTAIQELHGNMEYSELYDDAIADMKYHKNVMKLMGICGVHDFGMKDLHSPKAKRLQVHLSAIINFAKYREDRLILYQELLVDRNKLVTDFENEVQEQAMLKQHVENLRVQSSIDTKKVQELNSEHYGIEVEMIKKNKLQASLRNEVNVLTEQDGDLKYKIAEIGITLQETEREDSIIRSEIVRSPEKIQVQLEQLTRHVEEEKADIYNAEIEVENTKQKIQNVDDAIYQTQKFYDLVGDVMNEIERYKKIMEDMQIGKRDYAVLEERLKDLLDRNVSTNNILKIMVRIFNLIYQFLM